MATFLDGLYEEIKKVPDSDLISPTGKMKRGETVIAVIEDSDTKRLYVLKERLSKDISVRGEKHNLAVAEEVKKIHENGGEHDDVGCENCRERRELQILQKKLTALNTLFKASLYHGLSEEQRRNEDELACLRIGEGWKLIGRPSLDIGEMLFEALLQEAASRN